MTDLDKLPECRLIEDYDGTWALVIAPKTNFKTKEEAEEYKSQLESKLARYDKLERDNGAREQCSAILIESYKDDIRKLQSQHTNLVKAIRDLITDPYVELNGLTSFIIKIQNLLEPIEMNE